MIREIFFWVVATGFGVFLVISSLMILSLLNSKKGKGEIVGKRKHGHMGMELIWTLVAVILLVLISFPFWLGEISGR